MPALADALARTRLRPPRLRAALIDRPQLVGRLLASLQTSRLLVVSAPAGYGKTAVLTQALRHLDGSACAWVSIDEDDDLPRLLAALLAALDPLDLPWRIDPDALVQAAQRGAAASTVPPLVNALDAADVAHGVIVLDDLHRLTDPAAAAWLAALVERLPANWTLVLCGRQDPPLALGRWRAAGELAEFRQDSLGFSAHELQALGDLLGVSAQAAAPLLQRTGGWPAGARLALMVLQQAAADASDGAGPRPGAADHDGEAAGAVTTGAPTRSSSAARQSRRPTDSAIDPALFDYLASEVLAQLPEALQRFLRRCAVLTLWSPRRCAAVAGDADAARWLDEIAARGLFVAQLQDDGSDERVFVLHDLLRDCLLHLLQRHEPDALPALLQRAAAVEPDPLRRVALLQRAGAWEAAEEALCELGAETVGSVGPAALRRLFDAFPPTQRAGSARLQWLRGLAAWVDWHWSEMHSAMLQAQTLALTQGDTRLARRAAAHLALAANALELDTLTGPPVLRPLLDDADPEVRLCALVAHAWWDYDHTRFAPIASHFAALLALLLPGASMRQWYQSAPTPAFTAMPGMQPLLSRWSESALQACGEPASPLRSLAHTYRGWGALWAGRTADAVRALDEAEADCRWIGDPPTVLTPLRMARLLLAAWQGDSAALCAGVRAMLPMVVDAAPGDRPGLWQLLFASFGLRLAAAADDAELLAQCAGIAAAAPTVSRRPLYQLHLDLLPAQIASAERRWSDAATHWRRALARAPHIDVLGQAAEARLRLAHALLQTGGMGARSEAAELVRQALMQAREEGQPARLWMAGRTVLKALAAQEWAGPLAGDDPAPPDGAMLSLQLKSMWAALQAQTGPRLQAWAQARQDAPQPDADAAAMPNAPVSAIPPGTGAPIGGLPRSAIAVADGTAAALAPMPMRTPVPLSAREHEVLVRIAAGDSNKLIARAFDLSPHTVKRHVANILDKLGLASRGQAAAWWREHGSRP